MKIQKKYGRKLFALVLVCAMFCIALPFICKAPAQAEGAGSDEPFTFESVRAECERMTSTDIIEDADVLVTGEKPTVEWSFYIITKLA